MMLRPKVVLRAVENLIGNAVRYGSRAVVSVVMDGPHAGDQCRGRRAGHRRQGPATRR